MDVAAARRGERALAVKLPVVPVVAVPLDPSFVFGRNQKEIGEILAT